jgi:hypothetical protein
MVRTAGLLGLLGLLLAAPAANALTAQTPQVSISAVLDGGFEYSVIGTAISDQKHNRSEGQIRNTCDGSAGTTTDFIHDYDTPTTQFTTPTASVILLAGHTCSITISWLVGGGGSAGETATSSPKVVDTHIKVINRFDDDTKTKARFWRDVAQKASYRYMTLGFGFQTLSSLSFDAASVAGLIAADPADPAFRKRVRIRPLPPVTVADADFGSAKTAFDAYLAAAGDATADGLALVAAVDKAQGAAKAKKKSDRHKYERLQMLDAAGFAKRYAAALDTWRQRAAPAAQALRASGAPAATAEATVSEMDALRDRLIFDGVPADYAAELARLRVPKQLRASAAFHLASVAQQPGTIADDVDNAQSLYMLKNYAASMRRWAKAAAKHPTARPPA